MTTRSLPSLSAGIVRDFQAELALSRKLCEAAPEEHYDWQPHAKSMTLGALVGHIAEAPSWMDSVLDADSMDFADLTDYRPFVPTTRAELLEKLDENARSFEAVLDGRTDEVMRGEWSMLNAGKLLLKQSREEVIRSILLHHVAHHRGQLTVYLRLLDVPVPATYGSTADETTF